MKKRLICCMTLIALCCSLMTPGFAVTNQTAELEEPVEVVMENEIEARMAVIMEDVYRQLEEQDALILLDTFESILRAEQEQIVMRKYGMTTRASKIIARTGARETYMSPISGYQPAAAYNLYLDKNKTIDYIHKDDEFTIDDLLGIIIGHIPVVSDIYNLASGISSVVTYLAIQNINAAGGYARVLNVYNEEFDTEASVVTGWDDYPYVTRPANVTDYHVELLPE